MNSEVYEQECPECEGSGHGEPVPYQVGYPITADMAMDAEMPEIEGHMQYETEWEDQPCPTCGGSGRIRLEVADRNQCTHAGPCRGNCPRYRPMTVSEVEEYSKQWERRDIESLIAFVQAITKLEANDYYTYKGAKVRIGK